MRPRDGIRASLGFFSDVFIPVHALRGASWDPVEQVWVWMWEGNQMFMDLGETLRFRVSGVRFNTAPRPSDQVRGGLRTSRAQGSGPSSPWPNGCQSWRRLSAWR